MVRQHFSFFIFMCVLTQMTAKSFYETIPKNSVCKILDPQIVYNYTCTSNYINRTMSVFSQDITFQPGIVLDNYHVRIQLNRKFGKTFRPFMINGEQDFCALSNGNSIESLITKMLSLKDRRQYGNWYHPCPVSGRRYEIDAPMDTNKLPAMAMNGGYRLDVFGFTFVDECNEKEFCCILENLSFYIMQLESVSLHLTESHPL